MDMFFVEICVKMNLLLLCLSIILMACEGNPMPEEESNLVVEGWIEDGGFPVVLLTKSIPLSSDYQGLDSLNQYLVRWAKVSVSDGDSTVVLTGMYQKDCYPPYIYTTGRMRGKAGKTYSLTVEYGDYRATASTKIPISVPLDSVVATPIAESDTLFLVDAYFMDSPDTHDYYILFTSVNTRSRQSLISYMGYIDDTQLSGIHVKLPVYRGSVLSDDDYIPYFTKGDIVEVKLAHADATAFNFWNDVQNSVSFSTNMYMPVMTNVRTNITGGIGYWLGYGVSRKYVVVGESDLFFPFFIMESTTR